MSTNCKVLGPNDNRPGRTEKELSSLLLQSPLEQRRLLVSPRFCHLEVSQEVEFIKEPEHGVPMRTHQNKVLGGAEDRGSRCLAMERIGACMSRAWYSGGVSVHIQGVLEGLGYAGHVISVVHTG